MGIRRGKAGRRSRPSELSGGGICSPTQVRLRLWTPALRLARYCHVSEPRTPHCCRALTGHIVHLNIARDVVAHNVSAGGNVGERAEWADGTRAITETFPPAGQGNRLAGAGSRIQRDRIDGTAPRPFSGGMQQRLRSRAILVTASFGLYWMSRLAGLEMSAYSAMPATFAARAGPRNAG